MRGQFEVHPGQFPKGYMGVFGQYARGVDYLYKAIEQTSFSADHCSYPILYLMRHALEVGLKANIQCMVEEGRQQTKLSLGRCHNLNELCTEFRQLVEAQGILEVDSLAFFHVEVQSMGSLICLMPSVSSFRYTEERNRSKVFSREMLDISVMKSMFDRAYPILAYTPAVLYGPGV